MTKTRKLTKQTMYFITKKWHKIVQRLHSQINTNLISPTNKSELIYYKKGKIH